MFDYVCYSEEITKETDKVHGLLREARNKLSAEIKKASPDYALIQDLHLDCAMHQGVLQGLNIASGIAYREVMKK